MEQPTLKVAPTPYVRVATHDSQAETRFLEKLGTYQPDGILKISRKELLIKYIKTAEHRVNWGAMDKNVVLRRANVLLLGVMNEEQAPVEN